MDKLLIKIAHEITQERMEKQALFGLFQDRYMKKFLKEEGDTMVKNKHEDASVNQRHPKVKLKTFKKAPKSSRRRKFFDSAFEKWKEQEMGREKKEMGGRMKELKSGISQGKSMLTDAEKMLKDQAKKGNQRAKGVLESYPPKHALKEGTAKIKSIEEKIKSGKMDMKKGLDKIEEEALRIKESLLDASRVLNGPESKKVRKMYKNFPY